MNEKHPTPWIVQSVSIANDPAIFDANGNYVAALVDDEETAQRIVDAVNKEGEKS